MKTKLTIAAAIIALASAVPATAQEYTKGTIKEVKADQEKLTISHEELKNLGMPAMTMVYNVADPAMLEGKKKGDAIEFVADRIRGKLTVIEMK